MDANGSRWHLIHGRDWQRVVELRATPNATAGIRADPDQGVLTLAPRTHLFLLPEGASSATHDLRRSAAADAYGNLYRVGADRESLW